MSHNDPVILAAQRFYGVHEAEHLAGDRQRLIDRCTAHLADVFAMSTRTAEHVAMQVRSEIESTDQQAYIDPASCTPHMLVLRDPASNASHLVTVGDLLQLVKNRPVWIGVDLAKDRDQTAAG